MEVSTNLPFKDESTISNIDGLRVQEDSDSSDDNIIRGRRSKQPGRNGTETDSDVENADPYSMKSTSQINCVKKSRIKNISDSDSDSQSPAQVSSPVVSKVSRVENKRIKLHDKFKKLVTPQAKTSIVDSDVENQSQVSENDNSENSDREISCLKIKKKIMKQKVVLSSICDADTSDDDLNTKVANIKKQRKVKPKPLKSAIEIQPKMSAKQAMENMQKIKSESNRMLREKDVSLPYHKPRALSLQDIMKRKKATLTSDGKAMPIKMNSEQLAQYAKLLEERQREMIELCKSDSEEEAEEEKQDITNVDPENDCKEISLEKSSSNHFHENIEVTKLIVNEKYNMAEENDIIDKTKKNSNENIEIPSINSELTCQASLNSDIQAIVLKFNSEKETNEEENITNNEKDSVMNDAMDNKGANEEENLIDKEINEICIQKNYAMNTEETHDEESLTDKAVDENCSMNDTILTEIKILNNISESQEVSNEFSDDENEFNLEDIDNIIENAEIIKDVPSSDASTTHNPRALSSIKPKLTGAPGMVIDLESGDQIPKLLTGVDLLKERYIYFSNLKSFEDLEKNKIKKEKPGTQHLKLKYELEEQIAEQRSLEWEKRLEEERQLKSEMNIESYDDIEKLEAKLDDDIVKESSSSEDEDLVEDDVEMKDKPRKSNPMVYDEAEESNEEDNNIDTEEQDIEDDEKNNIEKEIEDNEELEDSRDNDDSDNSSSDDSSSESEDEKTKPKKGRILKAFEDSDDESNVEKRNIPTTPIAECPEGMLGIKDTNNVQDEEIQLAQLNRSISEDIFGSQYSHSDKKSIATDAYVNTYDIPCTADLGSQTFSILNSATVLNKMGDSGEILSTTQSIDESKFDSFNKVCPGSLSQNLLMSQSLDSRSQEIGDDIAALCTGKFYDNPFVSQTQNDPMNSQDLLLNTPKEHEKLDSDKVKNEINQEISTDISKEQDKKLRKVDSNNKEEKQEAIKPIEDGNILKSILDELNEPEIERTNKFFAARQDSQVKKRFIIDSDEENDEGITKEKKKILKKRKPEKRALQISDDEEEEELEEEEEESEIEEETEKVVEYDSEENEIEVKAKPTKKKRLGEFFENEAELTSEDEWVGSGDEDEAGLDRMEREEGDSEVFHQGQLQRELGQIHMREVLDQDKREVRLIQELLFEDGDLGDGHRQRKFRWKTDADGEDETGMGPINLPDTQEEEFESEEQWRKQRHERELFLKSMQEHDEKQSNTTMNRMAIIKANLNSSKVSNHNETKAKTETEPQTQVEAKPTKDIPSPKKSFLILQQSYHGSLLSRGRGALSRLAALVPPAAADAPRPAAAAAAPGNFVFATLSQPDAGSKVAKRKAESNPGTPKLLKKLKSEDTQKYLKNSLFDHFKT